MQMPWAFASLPGYFDAVVAENNIRDAAFVDVPAILCGHKAMHMTLAHWMILDAIESPFLGGKTPRPEDVPILLWVLSRSFFFCHRLGLDQNGLIVRLLRKRFTRSCRKLVFISASEEITRFIRDTFQDSPPRVERKESDWTPPHISFGAGLIDVVASNYHWSELAIRWIPLRRLFQYEKQIIARLTCMSGNRPMNFNPSDVVKYEGIRLKRQEKLAESAREDSDHE